MNTAALTLKNFANLPASAARSQKADSAQPGKRTRSGRTLTRMPPRNAVTVRHLQSSDAERGYRAFPALDRPSGLRTITTH